jgi:hypothetical protein
MREGVKWYYINPEAEETWVDEESVGDIGFKIFMLTERFSFVKP